MPALGRTIIRSAPMHLVALPLVLTFAPALAERPGAAESLPFIRAALIVIWLLVTAVAVAPWSRAHGRPPWCFIAAFAVALVAIALEARSSGAGGLVLGGPFLTSAYLALGADYLLAPRRRRSQF